MHAGVEARVAAVRMLDAVLHRGRSLKAEFALALPALPDLRDRALAEAICFAALRGRARYAAALSAWMPRPPGRRDGPLRALLYAGFAQLELALPAHAALSATVEAARALGRAHQAGLVNAVLRRAQRDGIAQADPSATWPHWLRECIEADWPDAAAAIFDASAVPAPPLWLRVNRRRIARDAYAQRLREIDLPAFAHPALDDALRIGPPDGLGDTASADDADPSTAGGAPRAAASIAVADLPGFGEGLVSVQDASAQLVADALAPSPGARVLDACAAPGGKAAHLLERDPGLRLTALDIDPRRVRRMAETFDRVGVVADARAADAGDPAAWWDGAAFDAILIDAPCSATGIVRRQPDILLHRRASDVAALRATQARLLDALWPLLAPDGALVYATCSVLRDENERQVDAFLTRTPDARAELLDGRFGMPAGAGRQRLPGADGMDGFFYARLRKRG